MTDQFYKVGHMYYLIQSPACPLGGRSPFVVQVIEM